MSYCVFDLFFSSSCIPNVASFSGLSTLFSYVYQTHLISLQDRITLCLLVYIMMN